MNKIRPWLYIGNYREAEYDDRLEFNEIKAILTFTKKIESNNIETLYLPIEDMEPVKSEYIKTGLGFILQEKEKGNNILIVCSAGISRSAMFCTAALKEVEGVSLIDAFKEVKQAHLIALPNKPVWDSFCEYYGEPLSSYIEVMKFSARFLTN